MISFVNDKIIRDPKGYGRGFIVADTQDLNRIAKCMTSFVWSPIVWRGGRRKADHFVSCRYLALDFDDGEMTLVEAERRFCDMRVIIGTTKSHQLCKSDAGPCDRFRILFEFEETITDRKIYEHNMREITKVYPCDDKAKDAGRFFFPCKEIILVNTDGYKYDVDKNIPVKRNFKIIDYSSSAQAGKTPQRFEKKFFSLYKPLARNHAVFCLIDDLFQAGFREGDIYNEVKRLSGLMREITPLSDDEVLETLSKRRRHHMHE